MLNSSEFATAYREWKQSIPVLEDDSDYDLQTAERSLIAGKRLSSLTVNFLVEAGLPKSSGGGISFHLHKGLPQLWEVYWPQGWDSREKAKVAQYLFLGETEEGDPVCIDTESDEMIVKLNHEESFSLYQYVNKSVHDLAACILVFNTTSNQEEAREQIKVIDSKAAEKDSFWSSLLR